MSRGKTRFLDESLWRRVALRADRNPQPTTRMQQKTCMRMNQQPQEFRTVRTSATPSSQEDRGAIHMDRLGLEFRDMTPALAQQWGYKEQSGVIITQVSPGSMAAEAGLELGVVLVKVDNHAVHSAAEARQALDTASLEAGILLQVQTPHHGVEFVMLRANS